MTSLEIIFPGFNVTWQITLYVRGRASGSSFKYLHSRAAVEHAEQMFEITDTGI